ncbi:hypothetical protein HON52_04510 [Candidatus Uhrbacteria bacterium]|jgi:hypothetical protein|nr:hypothetical protein [Candidatus Uhrbacteria bacterium]
MSNRLSQIGQAIIGSKPMVPPEGDGEETIEVSVPASTAAALYERVRTTLEYQEEHLLRRNAITRILRRYLGSDTVLEDMASLLLQELVWAKYLPNKQVPTSFINDLKPVFLKYGPIFDAAQKTSNPEYAMTWVLDVLSTEVEYTLISHDREEYMASYMYEELKKRTAWDTKLDVSEEDRDIRLFVACHKTLLKSNHATLRYRLMTLYYPDWVGASSRARILEIAQNLETVIATVDLQIEHWLTEKLTHRVRRKAGLFRVLLDVIENFPHEFEGYVTQEPDLLGRAMWKRLKVQTSTFRKRLRRTVVRAVAFLFITKMFLALILEIPYDLLVHGELFIVPLIVNILFHPIFLAIIGLTVTLPERRNAEDYKSAARALVVGASHDMLNVKVQVNRFGAWKQIFAVVYSLLFFVIYGAIAFFLHKLGFNAFSIALFLFFLSLVTFFGIRIRGLTRDIILSKSRRGIIGSMFDLLMLPIVRAGRWLSVKVAKVNVFIYFFDFIIEAPYKVAVRFTEEWFEFVKEKKEELS